MSINLIIDKINYFLLFVQVVSDCSLVASLAVSAQYEKKFGRRLITSIIYPRNKNKEPIYNPFGKVKNIFSKLFVKNKKNGICL